MHYVFNMLDWLPKQGLSGGVGLWLIALWIAITVGGIVFVQRHWTRQKV
jgi:hypothetical protein